MVLYAPSVDPLQIGDLFGDGQGTWQDFVMTSSTWQAYQTRYSGEGHTAVGDLWVCPELFSPQLGNKRDLVVYLPPSYQQTARRYPVIYMMDGQNLFDEQTAHAGEWQVDETMAQLAAEGVEAIIVGVANGGDRRTDEYCPFPIHGDGGGQANRFGQFVVETVMPAVASQFRVTRARADTFLFGSSLGALFSLYLLHERPDLFGGAGLMSPSLWPGDGAIFPYLASRPASQGRIYLDVGTRERSGRWSFLKLHRGSRQYWAATERLHRLLLAREPAGTIRYVVDRGAHHSTAAWAARLPAALRFLLANSSDQ